MFCDLCGSERLWLPRKSTKWRCWDCQKPSTEAIVAKLSFEETPEADDPLLAGCSWEHYLVFPGPICSCLSRIVLEVSSRDSIRWICWSCKSRVEYNQPPAKPREIRIPQMTQPFPGEPQIEYSKTGFTMQMLEELINPKNNS